MAYASRAGRARTSARNPQAHAICDRCGLRYNHVDLSWQFDWRGSTIQNVRILVCNTCLDNHQEQGRSIILPPDPIPVQNPRVQDFNLSAAGSYTGALVGNPLGLTPLAQMPKVNGKTWLTPLAATSVVSNGTTTVTVTFSAPHNLSTGMQIGILGLNLGTNASPNFNLYAQAEGIFSVTVVSATVLTYTTALAVPTASLLTGQTIIETTNVGIPRGATTVPVGVD
jgi:hypothetical protein